MKRGLILTLLLLLLATQVLSETIFERSFEEMGHSDLEVDGPNIRDCIDIPFVFPTDANVMAEENYPIASLNIELLPVKGKDFYAEVKLNDENVGIFHNESFFCEETCWARIALPKELIEEENIFEACLQNSPPVIKSILRSESSMGIYQIIDFSSEDSFVEQADKIEPLIGEKVKITILLHNAGSSSGFMEMKHARALAEDKEAFVVVDGNTQYKGFIKAGETIKMSYTIKPRVLNSISLPPAILYYSNEFGEPKQKFGKMVTINVREPERKVNAFVVKEKEINLVGTETEMQLAVKNDGQDTLFNLDIQLILPANLILTEEATSEIDVLQSGETKYLNFSVRSTKEGEYKIGCSVNYIDLNTSESKCEQSTLIFEKQEVPFELWLGLGLVGIAVVVYLYIQKTG